MPVMNYLTTCIFDHGAIAKLGPTLAGFGVTRPFIVTDPGIKAVGLLDTVLEHVPGEKVVFAETHANPTETQAKVAAAAYKDGKCDGIVALGGGSSMDMAKAVGILVSHDQPLETFAAITGGAKHITSMPPLVAVPTTAGTGSEVSVGAIVTLENGRKETFVGPLLIPKTAICDPELTLGLPAHLTAATGMDAVTHCIEAILSPVAHPPAEGIGYDGAERAIGQGWLKAAVEDGSNKDARWHMMMASYEGALAFVKGLGSVHALSHAAGRMHEKKLHHGTLNAIWLPHLLAFNQGAADDKYARLRTVMGLKPGADLAQAVADLNDAIGIPKTLSEIGVVADDGPGIVENALADLAHGSNARPATREDYEKLFEVALN